MQKDYDEDARRLMEFKTKQQALGRQTDDIQMQRERLEHELGE